MNPKHETTGQFLPNPTVKAHIPVVIGGPPEVTAPTSHGPLSPPGDVSDFERADIIREAAIRSTIQGGGLLQNAEAIARERGKALDPTFNPLAGL